MQLGESCVSDLCKWRTGLCGGVSTYIYNEIIFRIPKCGKSKKSMTQVAGDEILMKYLNAILDLGFLFRPVGVSKVGVKTLLLFYTRKLYLIDFYAFVFQYTKLKIWHSCFMLAAYLFL